MLKDKAKKMVIENTSDLHEDTNEVYSKESDVISVSDMLSNVGLQGFDNEAYHTNRIKQLLVEINKNTPNIVDKEGEAERQFQLEIKEGENIRTRGKGIHLLIEQTMHNPNIPNTQIIALTKATIDKINSNPDIKEDTIIPSLENINDDNLILVINKVKELYSNSEAKKAWSEYLMEAKLGGIEGKTIIRGKADLMFVKEDEDGSIGVDLIDIKVSSKGYKDWDIDKKNTTFAQLGFYQRILSTLDIAEHKINPKIFSIQLIKTESGEYKVNETLLTTSRIQNDVKSKIDTYIESEVKIGIDHDIINKVNKDLSEMFGLATYNNKMFTTTVDQLIHNNKRVKKVSGGFRIEVDGEPKIFETEDSLKEYLLKELHDKQEKQATSISYYINEIKTKLAEYNNPKNTNPVTFVFNKNETKTESNKFWNAHLLPFVSEKGWKVVDNPIYAQLGIILFKNERKKEIQVLTVSTLNVNQVVKINGNNNILGKKYTDDQVLKQNMTVRSTIGSLELMKILTILNNIPDFKDHKYTIGNIACINPYQRIGTPAIVPEKLVKNFKHAVQISSNNKMQLPEFKDRYLHVLDILTTIGNDNQTFGKLREIGDDIIKSRIHSIDYRLQQLYKIKDELDEITEFDKDLNAAFGNNTFQDYIYWQVNMAIAELSNTPLDYMNIESFTNWGLDLKNKRNFLNGLQINTLDTIPIIKPLNRLKESTDSIIWMRYNKYKALDRVWTKKYYDSNKLLTNNIVNAKTILFKDLFDTNYPGDLMLKKPSDPTLTPEQKEYLIKWLEDMNSYRYPGKTEHEIADNMWYSVPLMYSGNTSKFTQKGVKGYLKGVIVNAKRDVTNLSNELDEELMNYDPRNETTFVYSNSTILSDNFDRRQQLLTGKDAYLDFETNLEAVKDKYVLDNMMREQYNKMLPIFNAAIVNLKISKYLFGNNNDELITYITDVINSTVLNRKITPAEFDKILIGVGAIKNLASNAILGLNYRSGIKEMIASGITLYKHAVLNTRLDKDKLNVKEITFAYNWVWVDSVKQLNKITLGEELNFIYGMANNDVNDTDMRQNFESSEAFRGSSRMYWMSRAPDFLHRMTLLIGYMNKYNCLDAHSINDKGVLVYD